MKTLLAVFFLFICAYPQSGLAADADEPWTHMPAGAKSSYMGIHGGTMPVSLLVSSDGRSLLTFVGNTGDDFMEALRNAHKSLPTIGNSTRLAMPGQRAATGLFAGNATDSMPVFALPGSVYARSGLARHLQPFGLSDEPLSIEGEVLRPRLDNLPSSFRLFRLPDYFQPRSGRAVN